MRPYGEILKELRLKAGLSQKEEADKLRAYGQNVNNAHVSRWESGSNNPTIEQFIAVCELYGIRNVHETFGDGELLGLTADLNTEGIKRLMEYREILLRNPDYAPEGALDGAKPDPKQIAAEEKALEQARADAEQAQARAARKRRGAQKKPEQMRCYSLMAPDPIAEDDYDVLTPPEYVPDDATFAVVAFGDAMFPAVRSGARVWIEETPRLKEGDIGLFRLNGTLYLRRYRKGKRQQAGHVLLEAVNPAYVSMEVLPDDSFEILGRLVSVVEEEEGSEVSASAAEAAEETVPSDEHTAPTDTQSSEAEEPAESEESQ